MAARRKQRARKVPAKTKKAQGKRKAKKAKSPGKKKKTLLPRNAKKAKAKKAARTRIRELAPRKAKESADNLSATPRRGILPNQIVAVTAAEWDSGADPVTGFGWTGGCVDRNNAPNYGRASLTESRRANASFCDAVGDFEVVLCAVR